MRFSVVLLGACSAVEWEVLKGVNLCGGECGCVGGCKDTKNFHYAGTLGNSTACESTCKNDPAGKCKVWLWSEGTQHCWWRTDNEWNIQTSHTNVISGCSSDVPHCALAAPTPAPTPVVPTPPPSPFVPSTADNMNGEYALSSTPKGDASKFPTHYKDYPGGVEMFEVYSPVVTSLYSQVFWKGLEPVDLPEDIVKKFEGKGMAVVGFELDQVRKTPDGDVSVPINIAYNHHFESTMVGKKSKLEKIKLTGPDDPRIAKHKLNTGHGIGHDEHYIVHDLAPGNAIPTSQNFGGANGGEVRKSFHGYAPGFAQIIESPTQFQITPMQIDTWHREKMNLTGSPFVAGPEPRNSWTPKSGVDKIYSGLLECPLTTRITKLIDGGYSTYFNGSCPTSGGAGPIATDTECFEAARSSFLGANVTTTTGSDSTKPFGCSATIEPDTGVTTVYYNTNTASVAECGQGASKVLAAATTSLVDVAVNLDVSAQQVTITLVGPDADWFGVGFGASAMKDAPWAIIVEGGGKVSERKLADQSPGTPLASSVTVKSSSAINGVRTVMLTRPMQGATKNHYTFDASVTNLNFINAVGSGPTLAYHKSKTPDSLSFLPVAGSGACLCAGKAVPFGEGKGYLQYNPTTQKGENGTLGKVGFNNNCAPQPRTDLLAMKNPTCDVRTYVGGQTACHHMWSLLDADQEIPWFDQPLQYHLKFRFWVQEYNASYHTTVGRQTWGIASPVEYDVPKCAEGIMGCKQSPDGNWVHTITGTYQGHGKLVAAHFHCHAPTCLSIAMYRNDTGELLCEEKPIYGGTDRSPDARMNEPGFIAQPPCLWGDAKYGLQPPPDVNGVTLHSIKTSNATYGHHGEMAWQQMFLI